MNLKELAQLVKERVTMAEAWESLGYEMPQTGNKTLCPFHPENTPSLVLYPNNSWWCFGCNEGGDVIQLYQTAYGMSFPEATRALADLAGITDDTPPPAPKPQDPRRLVERVDRQANFQVAAELRAKNIRDVQMIGTIFLRLDTIMSNYLNNEISATVAIEDILRWRLWAFDLMKDL